MKYCRLIALIGNLQRSVSYKHPQLGIIKSCRWVLWTKYFFTNT